MHILAGGKMPFVQWGWTKLGSVIGAFLGIKVVVFASLRSID